MNPSIPEDARKWRVALNLWSWHTQLESERGRRIPFTEVAEATQIDARTIAAWMKGDVTTFTGDILVKLWLYYQRPISELFRIEAIEESDDTPGQRVPGVGQAAPTPGGVGW